MKEHIRKNNTALPEVGFVRLAQILAPDGPLPISRATWYQWQKTHKVPAPIRLGPRVTVYRRSDIEAFIANPETWRADK